MNQASQAAGGLFYDGLATTARYFEPVAQRSPWLAARGERVRQALARTVLPRALDQFVPETTSPQVFWDRWLDGLPMDNQMSERSLPTEFTELWLPLEQSGEVLRALRRHFHAGGYDATGPYITEIYAARATEGWLHPSYGRDSLRVDFFWFARNHRDPRTGWFVQFWKLLQPFGYRLHWGKHLPLDPELGHLHQRRHTPRWDDFLALRQQWDPSGTFLTRYWRETLGISP